MFRNMNLSSAVVYCGMIIITCVLLHECTARASVNAHTACSLDPMVQCEKKKSCLLGQCRSCTEKNDKCCCIHVKHCTCTDDINGTPCCRE